jgi:uncharacterized protein
VDRQQLDRVEGWVVVVATGAFVLLAELLLLAELTIAGLLLHSAILLLLLLYGTFRWSRPQRQLLVLAIPSISRLLAYTLPLGGLSLPFAYLVMGAAMGLTAVSLTWVLAQKRPFITFVWRRVPAYLALILLGAAGGLLLYQFYQPPPLTWDSPFLLLFYLFVLVIAMASVEEWLFRGIMQSALTEVWGGTAVVGLVTATFYALLSLQTGPLPFTLLVFLLSLFLSWLQNIRQNLFDVCLVHGALNLVFFLILPIIW